MKGGMMITTLEDALAAVAQVGPIAREHAQKSEDSRRLAPEVLDAIGDADLWGVFSPRVCGGGGLSALTELFEINRAMAYEDTSAGWALLIGAGGGALAGARMTDQARKEIFSQGCVPIAGVFNPGGGAAPADGGFVLNGRWPFASGITYAHWVLANAIALDDSGVPKPGAGGLPEIVTTLLAREEVEIIDDWHVAGLRGTGSMTFTVQSHFVPAHRTFAFFGPVSIDEPAFKIPVLTSVGAYFAGMVVGLAQRAVDTVIELLPTRVGPPSFEPASVDPYNQWVLGRARAAIRAAAESTRSIHARYDARLLAGEDLTALSTAERAEIHEHTVWVGETCRDAVDDLFRLGGANSIYDSSVLQRIWRDVNIINQHAYFRTNNHQLAGSVALGHDIVAPLL
jgi:alkylation response protein AidB-like acyl-CoA dehydrogenase